MTRTRPPAACLARRHRRRHHPTQRRRLATFRQVAGFKREASFASNDAAAQGRHPASYERAPRASKGFGGFGDNLMLPHDTFDDPKHRGAGARSTDSLLSDPRVYRCMLLRCDWAFPEIDADATGPGAPWGVPAAALACVGERLATQNSRTPAPCERVTDRMVSAQQRGTGRGGWEQGGGGGFIQCKTTRGGAEVGAQPTQPHSTGVDTGRQPGPGHAAP